MTTTKELIERLRALGRGPCIFWEAADHIEALSAEVERLSIARNKEAQETVAWMNECDQLRTKLDQSRAAHRKYEEDTLKLAQADDEERAALRAQLEARGEAVAVVSTLTYNGSGASILSIGGVKTLNLKEGDRVYTHPAPAAPVVGGLNIELAARKLAERFDYPWVYMPDKGRETMRQHAQAVLDAALHPTQPKGEKA